MCEEVETKQMEIKADIKEQMREVSDEVMEKFNEEVAEMQIMIENKLEGTDGLGTAHNTINQTGSDHNLDPS